MIISEFVLATTRKIRTVQKEATTRKIRTVQKEATIRNFLMVRC